MTNKIHVQQDTIKTLILRVVLRVPLVDQELSTYPEHLSSLLILVGSCYSIFCFMCTVL